MATIVWSTRALADLRRFREFLRSKSLRAAERAVRSIQVSVKQLEQFPAAGKPVDADHPDLREWLVPFGRSAYVVLYRVDGDDVTVIALRHSLEAGF